VLCVGDKVFNAELGLACAGARSDKPPGVFKDEVTAIFYYTVYGSKLSIMKQIYIRFSFIFS